MKRSKLLLLAHFPSPRIADRKCQTMTAIDSLSDFSRKVSKKKMKGAETLSSSRNAIIAHCSTQAASVPAKKENTCAKGVATFRSGRKSLQPRGKSPLPDFPKAVRC